MEGSAESRRLDGLLALAKVERLTKCQRLPLLSERCFRSYDQLSLSMAMTAVLPPNVQAFIRRASSKADKTR